LLVGSSTLRVGYTQEGAFAHATYEFPSLANARKVVELQRIVESQYGVPTDSSGQGDRGPMKYTWHQADGVMVVMSRAWPDPTIYLEFREPTNFAALQAEIKSRDTTAKASKGKAPSKGL